MGRCAVVAVASSAAACSVLVDSSREQCATDGDCQKRGGAFTRALCRKSVCITDPKWGCVGSVVWPTPVVSADKVTARFYLSNLRSGDAIVGATARVCGKLDPKCDMPAQSDLRSDNTGMLAVQLSKYFDGYLEMKYQGMVDTMYFFNPPVDGDRDIPFLPLVPLNALTDFGDQLKMAPLYDRGTVIGLSYDCQSNGAEGIQLLSDEGDEHTTSFYMADGFPSLEATQTDTSGQGGIANVPVGPRRISARLAKTGELIGTASVQSRAIWITYTSILPSPLSSPQ